MLRKCAPLSFPWACCSHGGGQGTRCRPRRHAGKRSVCPRPPCPRPPPAAPVPGRPPAAQIGLAPVGFLQPHSRAAVVAFDLVKTAFEKGGHRLRTAYHLDRESLRITFHLYLNLVGKYRPFGRVK